MIHKTIFLVVIFAILKIQSEDIPHFPDSFVGVFQREEKYFTDSVTRSIHNVQHNAEEKRTFVQVIKEGVPEENYWLIYNPPGSNSQTVKGYLEFKEIHRKRKDYWAEYCSYTSHVEIEPYPVSPPRIFPAHWKNKNGIKAENWFYFTPDMYFDNSEHSVDMKEWNSRSLCTVFGQTEPCHKLIIKTSPERPLVVQNSFQKEPGTFEMDWIQLDTWEEFHPESPTINLPWKNWITTCYNEENGISVIPPHAYVATPRGRDSFKVTLTACPIKALGAVDVKIVISSGCEDCMIFEMENGKKINKLVFNDENWDIEQTVYIKYKSSGEIYFRLVGTGGGYDLPHPHGTETTSLTLRAMTCTHGTPGYGCDY